MELRRKIVAHSDEEEMHFKTSILSLEDTELNLPYLQYNERLHLNESELARLEILLRKLKHEIYSYIFKLSQSNPELLKMHKEPESFKEKS